MTEAQPKLYTIIGTNGTGKSTFCKRMIQRTLDNGGRALVITPHDMEWLDVEWIELSDRKAVHQFTGIRKVIYEKDTLQNILSSYKNGLIVFDDCGVYFNAKIPDLLRVLFISRRQKNLNQIVVGHGFTQIPPIFFTFTSHFVLFRTTDKVDGRKKVLQNFELIKEHQNQVNKTARKQQYYHRIIKNG